MTTRPSLAAVAMLLIAASFAVTACAQPDSAHDSHEARGTAAPDTFHFAGIDDLAGLFEQHDYTLETWTAGNRTVPRFYLASVPTRWRKEVAPHLPVALKKQYFFFVYAPLVLESNEDILADRTRLLALAGTPARTEEDQAWLRGLAKRYFLVEDPDDVVDDAVVAKLERRVDLVPPSLALAQAAVESGWSTSRFADQGNALFGQWTWSEDGIKPEEQRDELGNYRIRSFASPEESIAAYMHNLNTHRSYSGFRDEREQLRAQGKRLGGNDLAPTLTSYSEKGTEYTDMLLGVIRVNNLVPADDAELRDMTPVLLVPVGAGSD